MDSSNTIVPAPGQAILSTLSNASSPSLAPPPSSPSLPTEILAQILELATAGTEPLERQETRIAFSKVSRAWYHGSRDAFSELVVDGSHRAERLATALKEEKKVNEHVVRRIDALVLLDEGGGEASRGQRFAELLKLVPSLSTLSLGQAQGFKSNYDDGLASSMEEALATLSPKRFALISLRDRWGFSYWDNFDRLLENWTHVEELFTTSMRCSNIKLAGSTRSSIPSSIRKLRCTLKLFDLILLPSSACLQELVIAECWVREQQRNTLLAIIAQIAATVGSLEISCFLVRGLCVRLGPTFYT